MFSNKLLLFFIGIAINCVYSIIGLAFAFWTHDLWIASITFLTGTLLGFGIKEVKKCFIK